jgi:hypothetical protein
MEKIRPPLGCLRRPATRYYRRGLRWRGTSRGARWGKIMSPWTYQRSAKAARTLVVSVRTLQSKSGKLKDAQDRSRAPICARRTKQHRPQPYPGPAFTATDAIKSAARQRCKTTGSKTINLENGDPRSEAKLCASAFVLVTASCGRDPRSESKLCPSAFVLVMASCGGDLEHLSQAVHVGSCWLS